MDFVYVANRWYGEEHTILCAGLDGDQVFREGVQIHRDQLVSAGLIDSEGTMDHEAALEAIRGYYGGYSGIEIVTVKWVGPLP